MPFAIGAGKAHIHYETLGAVGAPQAPWVVLIQGLGLSSRFWFDVPERLTKGPKPYRVVLLDNRGVGDSDRPLAPRYFMGTLADDVAAVLDDAKIPRAYVAGISLGGMIAQNVAIRHPSKVAGLVLAATSPGFPYMRMPSLRNLMTFMALPFNGGLRPREIVGESFARLLLAGRDVARTRELLGGWPQALHDHATPTRIYLAHFGSILSHYPAWDLKKITCPTVILQGDDDALLPLDNARALARLIPGSSLEIVPGGHVLHAGDPDCIRRALDRVRATASDVA
jgi:pimeloyl-ACP methyl ester carboxylesterase